MSEQTTRERVDRIWQQLFGEKFLDHPFKDLGRIAKLQVLKQNAQDAGVQAGVRLTKRKMAALISDASEQLDPEKDAYAISVLARLQAKIQAFEVQRKQP